MFDSNKSKKSKFSDKTLKKLKQKKYKSPVSFLNRSNVKKQFSRIKKKRNSSTRKLAKLFAYNTETKLPNIVNIYTIAATLLFICIGTLYFLFFTNYFKINTIQIYEGESLSINNQVRKLVDPLRNQNLILVSKNKINVNLHNSIDNIAQVKITKKFPKTLIIQYDKFAEVANLINYNTKTKESQKFVINEIGIITESDRNKPELKVIKIESPKNFQLGDHIITQEKLEYILNASQHFQEKFNMEINEIKYLATARELHLKTNYGFYIWLDIQQAYETQIQKLKNAIPKIDIYSDQFEYIDLRIESAKGDKIIYKPY